MVSIKKAEPQDANEMLEARISSFQDENKIYGYGPPGYDSIKNILGGIERGTSYKILYQGKIVGGISVDYIDEGHYNLKGIYIDLEYHNKGIGTFAMRLLEENFPDAVKWSLETPYLSIRNHHFYEKMGFVKVGETEPEADGFYLFLYEKLSK